MTIQLDLSGALKKIDKIVKRVDKIDWDEVGQMGLQSIKRNFDNQGRYNQPGEEVGGSTKWQPRKDDLPHPILNLSGALRNGVYMQLNTNGFTLISDKPYSAAQNYGFAGRNLPARPFMTIPPEEIQEMAEEVARQLTKGMR
tara:strand:- start:6323 stop:6748 length:426 start_codon:yes stop_codon:yes gene_type:complete